MMPSDDRVTRDSLLRSAVLRGDDRAWRTWYDESFDDLCAYTVWRCGGRHDIAEEIVQEVWLAAVKQIRRFDPELGSFAGWLRGISANVLKNHRRRRASTSIETLPDGEPQARQSSDGALEREERAERITAALVALPERYESVLRAKYLEQLSVVDIALTWRETTKSIESLLTRARDAFRRLYRDPGEELPRDLLSATAQGEYDP
jgi:RNA polymerase sigma-70 factor (ECF subfamily)